jgi:hypothetical protein
MLSSIDAPRFRARSYEKLHLWSDRPPVYRWYGAGWGIGSSSVPSNLSSGTLSASAPGSPRLAASPLLASVPIVSKESVLLASRSDLACHFLQRERESERAFCFPVLTVLDVGRGSGDKERERDRSCLFSALMVLNGRRCSRDGGRISSFLCAVSNSNGLSSWVLPGVGTGALVSAPESGLTCL